MKCLFCSKDTIGLKGYEMGFIQLCERHWNNDDSSITERIRQLNSGYKTRQ